MLVWSGKLGLQVTEEPAMKVAVWLPSDPDPADPTRSSASVMSTGWVRQTCDDVLPDGCEALLITPHILITGMPDAVRAGQLAGTFRAHFHNEL